MEWLNKSGKSYSVRVMGEEKLVVVYSSSPEEAKEHIRVLKGLENDG
jgi:hypothetical protein